MFKEIFLSIVAVTTMGTVTAQADGIIIDKTCSNTVISNSNHSGTYKLIQSCEYLINGDVKDSNTVFNDTASAKGIIDPEDLKGVAHKNMATDVQGKSFHKDDCIAQKYKK